MEPLVSIIVPVYNVYPYLREALDSIINQTYRNLEIIIVDDGSTDGSGQLCEEYSSDSRVRVIHQGNKGLSGARNTGLDQMTGEYVAFLDSDDAFYPETINILLNAIQKYDADIVSCGIEVCKTEGILLKAHTLLEIVPLKETVLSGQEALSALLSGEMSKSVCNKLFCKRILEKLRFTENHVYEYTV